MRPWAWNDDKHGVIDELLAAADYRMFVAEATDLLGFPVEAVVDAPEIHPHLRRSAAPL
ncbi:hypothetical protein [Brachybacterium vulturis]|uniref:hypothetical protein n=1 Tax=Brachybacterium vulturis TaxID=2017484 RepID=UPI003735DD76